MKILPGIFFLRHARKSNLFSKQIKSKQTELDNKIITYSFETKAKEVIWINK